MSGRLVAAIFAAILLALGAAGQVAALTVLDLTTRIGSVIDLVSVAVTAAGFVTLAFSLTLRS